MPHSRATSQSKTSKKAGGKKGLTSSPTAPAENAESGAVVQSTALVEDAGSTGETKSQPPSRGQSAAAMAAQLLSQVTSGGGGESNTSARRKASTGQNMAEKNQNNNASNVFNFLDAKQEKENNEASQVKAARRPVDPSRHTARPVRRRKASTAQSFHSDSGVSVREHSPDEVSSVGSRDSAEFQPHTPPDVPLDAVNWKLAVGSRTRLPMAGAYLTDTETVADSPASRSVVDLSAPETYYYPKQLPAPDPTESATMRKTSRPKVDTSPVGTKDKRRSSASLPGPADAHSTSPIADDGSRPRLYRQFGDLNHRLLSHLQNEIAQMEDDLSTLDELEKMHQSPSDTQASPRQKLLAAKFHDLQINDWSVLHDKRKELMEKLVVRTETYNRTLCAYSKSVRNLHSASGRDVESYRTAAQGQMTKTDRSILSHETDLIFLDPRHSRTRSNPLYATVAAIFAAVLLPLLAFGAITEFFGRMVVVAFTGAAIAFWASHGPSENEYSIAPQDGWGYAAGYFGFMLVAAMTIP